MILQALHELAIRERLREDPDYEPKPIPFMIHLGRGGVFLELEDTRHPVEPPDGAKGGKGAKKVKAKLEARRLRVPREAARTSGDRAFFLFDKAEYVLGHDPEGDSAKQRDPEKLAVRASLFRDRIRACAEATKDEGVLAVLAFLDSPESIARAVADLGGKKCASNDLFAFLYEPDIDLHVHERPKIREWWKGVRAGTIPVASAGSAAPEKKPGRRKKGGDAPEPKVEKHRCLVTGEEFDTAGNVPLVKRVPGGATSGVAVVSFNSPAFESYGLDGNDNAPIGRDAAESVTTALTRLLDPRYPEPGSDGTFLKQRHFRLSADTVVCYWSRGPSGEEAANQFWGWTSANPEDVKAQYHSIWKGRRPAEIAEDDFYVLVLSGAQGRAIVRDWLETTVSRVAANLAAHFGDLEIVRNCPAPRERGHPPNFPLGLLLEAVADPSKDRRESIPPGLAAELARASLDGSLYPRTLLLRAINRYRMEIGDEQDDADGWKVRNWNDARAAAIKAVLNRSLRREGPKGDHEEVRKDMNPTNRDEGYVLGTLMAVMERLQQLAIENVNASVVDRFFAGASACPRATFIRLLKNARNHARKAMDGDQAGLAFRLERLIDDRAGRFDPDKNGFPASLSLEQQGLFILGYHQMRRWLWMNAEERAAWTHEHPGLPVAFDWSPKERGDRTAA